jgi:hypothetical protein
MFVIRERLNAHPVFLSSVVEGYYNLTQLISRAHVLIPGNLSVLSSGTVILLIIGHHQYSLYYFMIFRVYTCLLVWMRL